MTRLEIITGDITSLDCDAIVNAANSELQEGGGVCGCIFRAAGSYDLQKECDAIGHCDTGCAVITCGYKLKAKHVIHAVGPMYGHHKNYNELLYSAYYKSLELAEMNQLKSIAFPAISTGIYGYQGNDINIINKAYAIALDAFYDYMYKNPMSCLELIIFCAYNGKIFDLMTDLKKTYQKLWNVLYWNKPNIPNFKNAIIKSLKDGTDAGMGSLMGICPPLLLNWCNYMVNNEDYSIPNYLAKQINEDDKPVRFFIDNYLIKNYCILNTNEYVSNKNKDYFILGTEFEDSIYLIGVKNKDDNKLNILLNHFKKNDNAFSDEEFFKSYNSNKLEQINFREEESYYLNGNLRSFTLSTGIYNVFDNLIYYDKENKNFGFCCPVKSFSSAFGCEWYCCIPFGFDSLDDLDNINLKEITYYEH